MFQKNKKNLALLAFASAFLLWGINTPLIKLSLGYVPIYFLLTIKLWVGGLFLLFFKRKKWKKLSRFMWFRIFVSTATGYALTLVFFYIGIKRAGGITASLIYLLVPLVVYFLSLKLLKERFNNKFLFGAILGLLGSILLVGAPLFWHSGAGQGDIIGSLFIVAAVFADAIGSTLIKPVLKTVPSKQVTTARFLIAGVMLLPFGVMSLQHIDGRIISWTALISVGYNIIFATIIAYSLFHYGLRKISGEQSSTFYYLDPLAGVIGSIVLLHEQLTPVMLLGGILVVGGVMVGGIKTSHHHFWHHR